jgi:hypothetical protein
MDQGADGVAVATEGRLGVPGSEKIGDIVCFTFFYLPMVGGLPSMMGRFFFHTERLENNNQFVYKNRKRE